MSIDLQERKQERRVTWQSLPELFSEMDEIHNSIEIALRHELVQQYLLQRTRLDGTYHWFMLAEIYDSEEVLVLFIEQGNQPVKPRFARRNRETGSISLIKGHSISGDVDEMAAIYDMILAMITGGPELKEQDVPFAIHLKPPRRPRHN